MKLYYAPGACSLASRISLHEAGVPAEFERVDIRTKVTERGADYAAINPKGYVPMLVLDDGQSVTENIALLAMLADGHPELGPDGPMGRTRLLEMLSFLSSELHIAFKPFYHSGSDAEKATARDAVAKRLALIAGPVRDGYLLGPNFTVADAYLFVMLRWAKAFGVPLPTGMDAYFERIAERDSVRQAITEEALPSTA